MLTPPGRAASIRANVGGSTMPEAASSSGSPIVTIVALGALTLLPFVFMTTTSFVKI